MRPRCAAALLVVLVGCGGATDTASAPEQATPTEIDSAATPPPSPTATPIPTPPTPTPTPTSTPPAPATPDPESAIPLPQTENETDFEVIWRELIEYHNWAFQNPDLADATVYLAEECECFEQAAATLDEYRANGWRETSPGLTVHRVNVDISASTFALMTVTDEHSELVVVDAEGDVVRDRERRPKTRWDVRVRLMPEGWRIVEWFQRGQIGDAE